jgi:hypothetical protein
MDFLPSERIVTGHCENRPPLDKQIVVEHPNTQSDPAFEGNLAARKSAAIR